MIYAASFNSPVYLKNPGHQGLLRNIVLQVILGLLWPTACLPRFSPVVWHAEADPERLRRTLARASCTRLWLSRPHWTCSLAGCIF